MVGISLVAAEDEQERATFIFHRNSESEKLIPSSVLKPTNTVIAREMNFPGSPKTRIISQELLKNAFEIGRDPSLARVGIHLPFISISLRHARIEPQPNGSFLITDLGSRNGTFVWDQNSNEFQRLVPGKSVILLRGEKFFVGPYALRLEAQGQVVLGVQEEELSIEVQNLCWYGPVPTPNAQLIVNNVSFKALPGDCVALLGPSGAGKTSLLNLLAGYEYPSSGFVLFNGQNLGVMLEILRGAIGYVPQDDLVHPELTVEEAISFSARMRLPADLSEKEIRERVEKTMNDLRLLDLRDKVIGRPEAKVLSGGERKRVNIALELVADPRFLLLDEPTSGLAADDTTSLVQLLSRLAREQRKTILSVIHQPAREEFEAFSHVMFLGFGGIPLYFGPPKKSYLFFSQYLTKQGKNPATGPRDIFHAISFREQMCGIERNNPKDAWKVKIEASQLWRKDFEETEKPTWVDNEQHSEQSKQPALPSVRRVDRWRQFQILLQRYALIKWRDRAGLLIILFQAPIIALLILAVFRPVFPSARLDASSVVTFEPKEGKWLPDFSKVSVPGTDFLPCLKQAQAIDDEELRRTFAWVSAVDAQADGGVPRQQRFESLRRLAGGIFDQQKSRFDIKVNDTSGAIFFMIIAAIWFGTSNAAREIVSEQAIFRRERRVNLSIINYTLSKFFFLVFLSMIQCFLLLGIIYHGVQFQAPWSTLFGFLCLSSACATAIGLLLSSLVKSPEAAVGLTPLALIPQVILGGGVVELTRSWWLPYFSALMPSRWGFEAALFAERKAVHWPSIKRIFLNESGGLQQENLLCATGHVTGTGEGALGLVTADRPWIAMSVLGGLGLTSLGLVAWILHRRGAR
jgi:ABC-type multidrug transport system ATPase subunit